MKVFLGLYPGRQVNAQTVRQSVIANLLKQGHDLGIVQQFGGINTLVLHKNTGSRR